MNNDDLKIRNRYLSLSTINPFIANNSGSRGYMGATALSGITQICDSQEPIIISTDLELGKGVMNISIDVDSKIHTYFIKRDRNNKIMYLQLVLVNMETHMHYHIDIPRFSDNNYTYGFEYLWESILDKVLNGTITHLPKGTVLARSPGSKENMGYALGVTANTLYVSHPSGAEDTYIVSESFAKRAKLKVYSRIQVSYGLNSVLTNAYGTTKIYKPFPSVGEYLREDRLLCAVRKFDETNIITRGHNKAMLDIHPAFDECTYVPHPNGKVVNIEVIESPRNKKRPILNLDNYIKENVNRENNYWENIVRYSDSVSRDGNIVLDPDLINLVVKAKFNMLATNNVGKVIKLQKKDRLDLYTINFTIEHELTMNNGYKITNLQGGKGVVLVVPDDTLPKGVEVLSPIDTFVKRMNIGAMYEPYFGGISRNIKEFIVNHYNKTSKSVEYIMELTTRTTKDNEHYVKQLCATSVEHIWNSETDTCFDMVLRLIKPLDNPMYRAYLHLTEEDRKIVLESIFLNECTMLYSVEDRKPMKIINDWDKDDLKVEGEELSFINPFSGNREVVHIIDKMKPMPVYFVVQSKIPFDGLLTNTANVNHFGLPVTVTSVNKYRLPFKNNPSKTYDETFTRILTSHTPERLSAELMSRASSPDLQRMMCENILKADQPTNIDRLLDRDKIGYGQSKSLQYANHILETNGVTLKYVKDSNTYIPYKGKI